MQHRAAFGEDGDVEFRREPIYDRAQCCERLGGVAGFSGDRGEGRGRSSVRTGALFARAIAQWRVRSTASLVVITLRPVNPPAPRDDFREVHFLVCRFGQVFGFTEVRPGVFKLVYARLIFGELRQVASQKVASQKKRPLRSRHRATPR